MKQIKLLAVGLVILVALGMGFISCGGDDEEVYGTLTVINGNETSLTNENNIVKIEILDADGWLVVDSKSYDAGRFTKENSEVFTLPEGTYKLRIDLYNSAGWTMRSPIVIAEGAPITIRVLIGDADELDLWPSGTLNLKNEDTTANNYIIIVEVLKANGSLQSYHFYEDDAFKNNANKNIDIPDGTYRLRIIWNDGSKWEYKSTFTINSDDESYGLTTVNFNTTASNWGEAPEVSIDDPDDPDYVPLVSGVKVYNRNSTPAGNYIAKIVVLQSDGTTDVSTHTYTSKFTKDVYAEIDLEPGDYKLKITRGGGTSSTWTKQSTFTVTYGETTNVDFYVASADWD